MLPYFQKLNVLSDDDYKNLMLDKDEVFQNGKGTITIDTEGNVDRKNYNPGIAESSDTSKNLILNFTFDIERFRVAYPDSFIKTIYAIKDSLEENDVKNPMCASAVMYRNNVTTIWHKHGIFPGVKASNFWVVIYYMHPNWDPAFGGQLSVGYVREENLGLYDCLSNSFVAHTGIYGHGVDHLKLGYEGHRDILLTHWITELPKQL